MNGAAAVPASRAAICSPTCFPLGGQSTRSLLDPTNPSFPRHHLSHVFSSGCLLPGCWVFLKRGFFQFWSAISASLLV